MKKMMALLLALCLMTGVMMVLAEESIEQPEGKTLTAEEICQAGAAAYDASQKEVHAQRVHT